MSTSTQELAPETWVEYFDSIVPNVDGQLVTIETMSEELGDQVDAERLPLQAIGYDPKDKMLDISVGGRGVRYPVVLRHFISNPKTISVEESGALHPTAILVTDESGARTLIRLFEPPEIDA
jgi:Family of unknown function (DUF5335)